VSRETARSKSCSGSSDGTRGAAQGSLVPAPPPFQGLVPFGYDLIMADPPWPVKMRSPKGEKKSAAAQYGLMSFEEIAALPIGALAAKNSAMFLWLPSNMPVHGGDPDRHYRDHDAARSRVGECVKKWGFRFVFQGAWIKRTVTGKLGFGTGYRNRNACDPWWVCIKGDPKTPGATRLRNVIESMADENAFNGLRRRHSEKPEEAFEWCERLWPHARKLELFSRRNRPGWTSWGYEAGKFDPMVTTGVAA
jgi:N6-adenosine-specific RNA methylase IME4